MRAAALLLAGCVAFAGCATPPARVTDAEAAAAAARGRRAFDRGQFEPAARAYRAALDRARLVNDPVGIGDNAYNLAACLIELERPAAAQDCLAEAQAEFAAARDAAGQADAWLLQAKSERLEGKADRTAAALDSALACLPAGGEEARRAQIHILKAELADAAGDAKSARAALAAARKAADRAGETPSLLAGLARAEAGILRLEGNAKEAAEQFRLAAEHFRRAGRYRDMAEALAQAAGCCEAGGQSELAADLYLASARSQFAQGDPVRALKSVSAALAAAEKSGQPPLQARAAALFREIKDAVEEQKARSPAP